MNNISVRLSQKSLNFITEYVFGPLNTAFYIDGKILSAIDEWTQCYDERENVVKPRTGHAFDKTRAECAKRFHREFHDIEKNLKHVDYGDLNQRLGVQMDRDGIIDKNYLRLLAFIGNNIDVNNEYYQAKNARRCCKELSQYLDDTIEYINTCSKTELAWISQVFDGLAAHFSTQIIIDCVEWNVTRFDDPELQASLKKALESMKINKEHLKELVDSGYKQWEANCPADDVTDEIIDKIRIELSKNLDDTIEYINNCTERELNYISQTFEELSAHFRSQKLIDCVERNVTRFGDPELQASLKQELIYMKMNMYA